MTLRPCSNQRCPKLTTGRYCEEHDTGKKYGFDDNRESATKRGYDYQWQKARSHFLLTNPFCVHCLKEGKHVRASVVDHIVPHKGNKTLFWDRNNWQPLCESHHNSKTRRNDMGSW